MMETINSTYSTDYAKALTHKFDGKLSPLQGVWHTVVIVEPGNVFDKLLIATSIENTPTTDSSLMTCFALVNNETGYLYKPGSDSPTRFNLSTPKGFAKAVKKADRYGSFLNIWTGKKKRK